MRRALSAAATAMAAIAFASCGGSSSHHATTTVTFATVSANPCTLLSAHELAAAIGTGASGGTRVGPTCTYTADMRGVQVRVAAATAAARAALGHVPAGGRRLVGPEFRGYVVPVQAINVPVSGQAQLALVKGATLLTIVLTDPSRTPRALVTRVGALGRAAATRL